MNLGLSTWALAWSIGVPGYPPPTQPLDVFAVARFAADLGLRLIQIADNLPQTLDAMPAEMLDQLRAETERLGLAVEIGTRGIDHFHLRRYIEIARQFGSPILRVVVDTKTHKPSPNEVVAIVGDILPEFERAGIILGIENHDRFKATTLAEMMQELDNPYVGIVLDTVNSFGALEGPELVVEALGPYVVNLHVKEFRVRRLDTNMGFAVEGVPAGQGMLDIPWLLTRLRDDYGRSFNAILEQWPPPEASADATAEKEQAWARESVAYLRGLIDQ